MTPKDCISKLSGHLGHQGITANPADVEAFAKSQGEGGPSMDVLTDCFVKTSRTYAVEFHKRKEARNAMLYGVAQCAVGLAACFVYVGGGFDKTLPPSVRQGGEPLLFCLITGGPIVIVLAGLLYGLSWCRSWRASNSLSRLRKASAETAVNAMPDTYRPAHPHLLMPEKKAQTRTLPAGASD